MGRGIPLEKWDEYRRRNRRFGILATLGVCVWWVVGSVGMAYWWTKEHDLTTNTVPTMMLGGVLGPTAWLWGCAIHGPCGLSDKVLIPKQTE